MAAAYVLPITKQPAPAELRHSDFDLRPFLDRCDRIASWQIANTLIPYGLLWWLAVLCVRHQPVLLGPVLALMVLLLARCFSLMHDCGHQALFQNRHTNRWVGFLLGVVAGIPQLPWAKGHAFHHRHNGNWEKYKGPSALVSVSTYKQLSQTQQSFYRWLRHPLMLLPGGFFYLVIKPRVELIAGLAALVPHALHQWRSNPDHSWQAILNSHSSRWWHSPEEFRDLLLNNLMVILVWLAMSSLVGAKDFWLIYAPVMACAAAIFICIFFVQHNFPGSYAHRSDNWDPLDGTLHGTSNLDLPPILNWFSANIGCHAIHHLCEAIPNYRLRACQEHNQHLLENVKRLRLQDLASCFPYILWDEAAGTLTTIDKAMAQP
ncbi:MAG: fatty acid desaturase [Cyanobium sp.]